MRLILNVHIFFFFYPFCVSLWWHDHEQKPSYHSMNLLRFTGEPIQIPFTPMLQHSWGSPLPRDHCSGCTEDRLPWQDKLLARAITLVVTTAVTVQKIGFHDKTSCWLEPASSWPLQLLYRRWTFRKKTSYWLEPASSWLPLQWLYRRWISMTRQLLARASKLVTTAVNAQKMDFYDKTSYWLEPASSLPLQ